MPDVGVLQLTIRDNSNEAGSGLNALAGALGRVREAVSGGLKLGGVANEVTKLAKTIQEAKGTSTIVKNLGTMFNAINKFSQLKDFSIDAEKLRDTALYMNKVADGLDRVNESRRASVAGGGAHDLYGQMEEDARNVKDALEQTANSVEKNSRRIFNIQLFGGKGETGSGQIASDIKETISVSNDAITVANKVGEASDAMQQMRENMVTTSSEVQQSIESVAEKAMELPQQTADAIANTTVIVNESGRAVAGMISIYDELEGHYKDIRVDTREAISLLETPASGKNGVFANASEELSYLTEKIEEAKASQQQWLSINEAASKQIKYGGGSKPMAELLFDEKHSAEGYYLAIEAEQKYKDAIIELSAYMNEYKENATKAAEATEQVAAAANDANAEFVRMAQANANSTAIQMIFDALETRPNVKFSDVVDGLTGVSRAAGSAKESMSAFLEGMQDGDAYAEYIRSLNPELAQLSDKVKEAGGDFRQLDGEIQRLIDDEKEGTASTFSFGDALKNIKSSAKAFKTGLKSAFPLIAELGQRLKSIMIRRTLTAALRKIVSGAKEGLQNVYEYSKAIGSSFAPSMDSAASSIATMKNALGAALAPAIQAMIPFLNTLINGFINLLNYVNQFFALLNGQKTWTHAITQTASAFDKQKKAAKGASSAMKDLLADWDELNIIQSQNGGGSGTTADSSAEDYANMFEEVSEFSEAVKDVVGWIQDHLGLIKNVAKAIGIAILGWKLSKAFSAALGTLGSLVLGATGIVVGLQLAWEGAHNAGLNGGFDSTTLLTTAAGILSTTIGGALIGFKIGGIWGAVVGGAAGLIASISVAYSAYIDGERTRKLLANWNAKDEFSPDEIAKYIENSFTFPIAATIENIDLITSNATVSATNLNKTITTFNSKYTLAKVKVGLDADDSEEALAELNTSANDVIKAFNERVDSVTETVKASIELLPLVGKDGEEYTEGMIDNLMVGNKELKEYMTSLGTDIAQAYNEAVIKHWGEGTEEAYLKQIERLNNIIQKKEEYVTKSKLEQKKNVALENMNYKSAEQANEEIEKWKQEYIDSARAAIEARRDGQLDIAGYWTGVLDDFSKQFENGELDISLEEYKEKKKEYEGYIEDARNAADADSYWLDHMDEYLNQQIDELKDYQDSMEQFRKKWIEVFKENEGYDITSYATSTGKSQMEVLRDAYKRNPSMLDGFVTNLISTFNSSTWTNGIGTELSRNVRESNGIYWAEIMNDSDKKNLMDYLSNMFDSDFARAFVDKLDISDEIKDSFYKYLPLNYAYKGQFDTDVYSAIKDAMQDGLKINEISNIKDHYGIDNYTFNQILKELGYRPDREGNADIYAIDPSKVTSIRPIGMSASMGMSDTGWAPYVAPTTSGTMENADISGDVAKGTAQGNTEQNDLIQQLINIATRIANKDFSVNVTPSAAWGNFNEKTRREFSKVNGL